MYQETLMEHYKYPYNKVKLSSPSFSAGEDNTACGDKIFIEGIVQNDVITNLGFDGSGCVISQAAASMLLQACTGKTLDEVLSFSKDDMIKLLDMQLGPTRLKCALLSLQVLHQGVLAYKQKNL